MINFYFSDGTKQVLKPSIGFFTPKKGELSVISKCHHIMNDLRAYRFEIIN